VPELLLYFLIFSSKEESIVTSSQTTAVRVTDASACVTMEKSIVTHRHIVTVVTMRVMMT
jgi:hypothetical protein